MPSRGRQVRQPGLDPAWRLRGQPEPTPDTEDGAGIAGGKGRDAAKGGEMGRACLGEETGRAQSDEPAGVRAAVVCSGSSRWVLTAESKGYLSQGQTHLNAEDDQFLGDYFKTRAHTG